MATASTPSAESSPTAATAAGHDDAQPQESPLHERSGIQLRYLIRFVIAFIVVAVVVHLVVWWIFIGFRSAVNQPREITGVNEARIPPPEPRLQPSVEHNALPGNDLEQLRATERAEFARRGWVDDKTGEIRVPDDLARRLARMSQTRKQD